MFKKKEDERQEREKTERIENAVRLLPEEPKEDFNNMEIITIRFRLPMKSQIENSNMVTRRFMSTDKLKHIIACVESLGFFTSQYKLLQNYPRKDVSFILNNFYIINNFFTFQLTNMESNEVSLKELGLQRRDQLIIEVI